MPNHGPKRPDEQLRGKGHFVFALFFTIALFALPVTSLPAIAAGPAVCLYRVGNRGPDGLIIFRNYLEGKGYQVNVYRGEDTIEAHIQKANQINRSGADVFLAVEIVTGAQHPTIVASSTAPQHDGRFLTVDEIPGRFSDESQRLADAVASAFGVKTKRMPLFPLLGITMPGIFLRIQGPESDFAAAAKNLHMGLEKYFRKG